MTVCPDSAGILSLRDSFNVLPFISISLRRFLFIFFCCRLGTSKIAPISLSHCDSLGVSAGDCICIGEVECPVSSDSMLVSIPLAFSVSCVCSI